MAWSRKQFSTLFVVSITAFMGTFLVSAINIALPSIEKSFSLTAIELSWIVTAYLLATAMFLLPVGKWGDMKGNTRLFKIGLVIFTIASAVCAFAPNGTWLIAARFLQGVGSAFSNTTGNAILVSSFPPRNRGQVIGISVSSVYAGLALGPFIGGIIIQQFGWQTLFYIAVVLGVACIAVATMFLRGEQTIAHETGKLSMGGTFVFMIGLAALVYGSSLIPSWSGWALMFLGIVCLVAFWMMETRSANPVFDTKLFTRNKLFAYSNVAALINYTATFAIVFFLSLFLQKIKGLSPREAGGIIIAQPVMMAFFSPMVGKLSDRVQPRYLATIGMSMCAIGLAALGLVNSETPIAIIVAILVWEGLGFAFFSSPNMNTIMSSVERTQYGQASGIAASMRVFGQIVSMIIVTLFIAALFQGKSVNAVSDTIFMNVMKWGFLTFAMINLVGIYFSFTRGNVKRG